MFLSIAPCEFYSDVFLLLGGTTLYSSASCAYLRSLHLEVDLFCLSILLTALCEFILNLKLSLIPHTLSGLFEQISLLCLSSFTSVVWLNWALYGCKLLRKLFIISLSLRLLANCGNLTKSSLAMSEFNRS